MSDTPENERRDEQPPLFDGEPEHCAFCGEPGHTHDEHWLFQFEAVEKLALRVKDLERQLASTLVELERRTAWSNARLAEARGVAVPPVPLTGPGPHSQEGGPDLYDPQSRQWLLHPAQKLAVQAFDKEKKDKP